MWGYCGERVKNVRASARGVRHIDKRAEMERFLSLAIQVSKGPILKCLQKIMLRFRVFNSG